MLKNKIFILLFVIFVILSIIFSNVMVKNIENTLLSGLNANSVEDTFISKKVKNVVNIYQSENFVLDNSVFVLCDDVSLFNEYLSNRTEIEKALEIDPFTVIENLDSYDVKYEAISKYAGYELNPKNDFVFEEDNKYLIAVKDMVFDDKNLCIVKHGYFERYIYRNEVGGITFSDAQLNNYVEYLGSYNLNGYKIFEYYNNLTNTEIKIKVKMFLGFVLSCERE